MSRGKPKCIHYLLSIPEINVDISHLIKRDLHKKAVDECKEYVTKRMETHRLTLAQSKTENIFPYLLFALKKDLGRNFVKLLVSVATSWDIVDLITYKQSAKPSQTGNKRAASTIKDDEVKIRKL